jgi:hypothetical protein
VRRAPQRFRRAHHIRPHRPTLGELVHKSTHAFRQTAFYRQEDCRLRTALFQSMLNKGREHVIFGAESLVEGADREIGLLDNIFNRNVLPRARAEQPICSLNEARLACAAPRLASFWQSKNALGHIAGPSRSNEY